MDKELLLKYYHQTLLFFKNPQQYMRNLPDWSFKDSLLYLLLFSLVAGVGEGLVSLKFYHLLRGILFSPFQMILLLLALTLLLYYLLLFYFQKEVPYLKLFTLVIFAHIPILIFQIFSGRIAALNIVGLILSALLLIVGLVDNYSLYRKKTTQIIFGIYSIFILIWVWESYFMS